MGRVPMTEEKKWFLWSDLSFAAPGVLTLALLAYALARGADGPRGWAVGTGAVGLCFVGIWLRVVLLRRR